MQQQLTQLLAENACLKATEKLLVSVKSERDQALSDAEVCRACLSAKLSITNLMMLASVFLAVLESTCIILMEFDQVI